MFCNKCGANNSDEAIFCQKCGFRVDGEEETKVARSLKSGTDHTAEQQIFSIRPTLLFVKIGYAATIAGAFLLVALLSVIGKAVGWQIPWWISIVAGLSLLLIPAFYHLKRNVVRYTLTDSKVEIDEGFISQKTRNVPLRTIQDVSVSSTIPQRMLGFGDLIIENASDTDGRIILKNINKPKRYADALLKQMRLLDK
ncbi:MAG: PH domain-containing protein [Pyrinomonadaceae bacterium]